MTIGGVLFVSNFLSAHGFSRSYAEELADRIESRGWRVTRTSSRATRLARLADMLATSWMRRHTYEVAQVDVFSGPAFVWAEAVCLALARLGKPYVLTLHGGNLPAFARMWPRRVRQLLRSAAQVTAPSPYLQDAMTDYRPEIVLRRNAIDVPAIRFRRRDSARPRLIWVRAFHAIYNPTLAIDVVARLRNRYPKVTLKMLGPDKGDGSLQAVHARIAELGVADHVEITGRVPKTRVFELLDEADLMINTTHVDNTPLSLLEAMAAGVCVVTTSVGGIPYLIDDRGAALLVPPDDAAAMADAVARVCDEPALACELSRSARELAIEHDWNRVLDDWEATFRTLGASAC